MEQKWIFVGNVPFKLSNQSIFEFLSRKNLFVGSIKRFKSKNYAFVQIVGQIEYGEYDFQGGQLRILQYTGSLSRSKKSASKNFVTTQIDRDQIHAQQLFQKDLNEIKTQIEVLSSSMLLLKDQLQQIKQESDFGRQTLQDSFKSLSNSVTLVSENVSETKIWCQEFDEVYNKMMQDLQLCFSSEICSRIDLTCEKICTQFEVGFDGQSQSINEHLRQHFDEFKLDTRACVAQELSKMQQEQAASHAKEAELFNRFGQGMKLLTSKSMSLTERVARLSERSQSRQQLKSSESIESKRDTIDSANSVLFHTPLSSPRVAATSSKSFNFEEEYAQFLGVSKKS